MTAQDIIADLMVILSSLSPIWIVIGGIAFADLCMDYLIKMVRSIRRQFR